MPDRGHDFIVFAEIFVDGFCLGRGFNDDELHENSFDPGVAGRAMWPDKCWNIGPLSNPILGGDVKFLYKIVVF